MKQKKLQNCTKGTLLAISWANLAKANMNYVILKNQQHCFIGFKTRGVAECFKPDKTYAVSFFVNVCNRSTHL